MAATLTVVRNERIAVGAGINAVLVLLLLAGQPLIALALAIVVPTVGLVLLRPQRGVLILAALAPFDGLLIIAGLPGIANGWKEGLVLLTAGATLVAPAESRASEERRVPAWAAGVVALFALAIASALFSGGGLQGLLGLKIGFFYLLLAWALWRCPLTRRDRDRLVTVLLAAGIATSAFGILQQLLGHARLAAMGWPYNETIRFTGSFLRSFSTFNQPFPFGFFVMLVLLVGVAAFFEEPNRLRSKVFLLATPVLGLGLLSTFVRGAWLGVAVGVAYLGAMRYKALLLLIPLALVGILFLPADVAAPALQSKSAEARTSGWQENFATILSQPLGVGLGTTGAAAEKAVGDDGEIYQPDNYYFKTLYELGVVGLWLYTLVTVSIFGAVRRRASQLTGFDAGFASAVAAMVLAAAVASLVAMYLEIYPMDLYFWLFVGAVSSWPTESS